MASYKFFVLFVFCSTPRIVILEQVYLIWPQNIYTLEVVKKVTAIAYNGLGTFRNPIGLIQLGCPKKAEPSRN